MNKLKLAHLSLALFAGMGFCSVGHAQVVMSQNFEGVTTPALPAGWAATHTGSGNGFVTNNGTAAWAIGTLPAHTNYVFVDEYNHNGNNPAYLTSPTFSLAGIGASAAYLSYDYFYFQAHLSASPYTGESAWVDISTDGGTTYTTVDSVSANTGTDWQTKYVPLSAYAGMSNLKLRLGYSDHGAHIIGWAADNITVFGAVANDLALTSVAPVAGAINDYFLTGSSATFSGTVLNNGLSAVSSYTVYYQVGAGTPSSTTVPGSIASFGTGTFTCSVPYSVAAAGVQQVKMWVSLTGDTNATNDSMNTSVTGVAFMPHKRILFEEATGSWCGFCVRGIVYMDSLWELHAGDVSIVSVHDYNTYDPMAQENASTQAYDAFAGSMISGFPSMIIDRRYTDDPSGAIGDYDNDNSLFAFADMTIATATTGGTVTATVTVKPALNMSGDYRLELLVTEDSVTGASGGYAQHNYYGIGGSASSSPLSGAGYNFNDSAQVIPAGSIKFPFVDRWTIPNDLSTTPNGVAGSLPASMTAGTTYSYSFAPVTIASDWHANRLRYVAALIDNTTGSATMGQVLNSINSYQPSTAGVTDLSTGVEGLNIYPNPASSEAHILFNLKNAGKVQFSVYDMTGRQVFATPAEQMTAGGQQINISTTDYAAGVYNVVITTDNGKVTERLSVVK